MNEFRKGRIEMKDIMPDSEWKTSGVTCLAGRPAMGKTTLAIEFMLDAVLWMAKPILWFSLEKSTEHLVSHMVRNVSGDTYADLAEKQGWHDEERVLEVCEFLKRVDIFIDDTPGITVAEVEKKVRNLKDVGLVIIDYVQLMTPADTPVSEKREEELRWIVQQLSRISKENQVPILMLAQLPSKIDKREDKRPRLDDLQKGIDPETLDQVIFLYRDGYYKEGKEESPETELILAKSKSGKVKTVKALFERNCLCFKQRN